MLVEIQRCFAHWQRRDCRWSLLRGWLDGQHSSSAGRADQLHTTGGLPGCCGAMALQQCF